MKACGTAEERHGCASRSEKFAVIDRSYRAPSEGSHKSTPPHPAPRAAYRDYQETEFGGWPWPKEETKDNSFSRETPRHASYAMPDGSKRLEYPPGKAKEEL